MMAALSFLLPCETNEKVGLEITVLLSLAVMQLVILGMIPASSETLPLIGLLIRHQGYVNYGDDFVWAQDFLNIYFLFSFFFFLFFSLFSFFFLLVLSWVFLCVCFCCVFIFVFAFFLCFFVLFIFFFLFFLLKVNLFVGSCVLVIHSLREIRVIYVVRATASARAARLPIRTSVCSISVCPHIGMATSVLVY